MLTSTLRDAAPVSPTCGLTPGAIPMPPAPTTFEIKPLFKVDTARWTAARNAGSAGDELSFQVNYDYKQLFPKLDLTETQLLNALVYGAASVVDHRAASGQTKGPYTRSGYTWIGTQWVRTTALTAAQRAASLTATVPPGDVRNISKEPMFWRANTPQSTEKLTAWADKLLNQPSYPALESILSTYGYNPGGARTLAKFLVSKQVLIRAMLYRSKQFLPLRYGVSGQPLPCATVENSQTRDQSWVKMKCSDFATSYKGLTNPYAGSTEPAIYKPFVNGTAWLWRDIPTPFPEDADHTWTLSAKYEGGSLFRIYLTRATVRREPYEKLLGALKAAVSWICDKITRDDLQLVVNAAGAVPEPNTQAVVTAWKGAAMACDMAFPTAPAPLTTCPELATTPPIEPTFWDLYQKPILFGGAGVVALLLVKQFMGRGKVRP